MNELAIVAVYYSRYRLSFICSSNRTVDRYHFTLIYYRDGIPKSIQDGYKTKIWNEHFLIKP